jgi:hypothetical protein
MSVSLKHGIVLIAATASLGAAGTHFAVIGEHLQEYALFGYLFLALAWFQAVWAIAFLMRSSVPMGWLGIIVNLGAVTVWAWSRYSGLPIGPEPWQPETVGPLDVAASLLEVILAVCAVVVVTGWGRDMLASHHVARRATLVMSAVCSAVVIGITAAAFIAQSAEVPMG